ncbi:MAG: HPF/RaiA family ribosome-associated protein [Ferruginibacter sp.]
MNIQVNTDRNINGNHQLVNYVKDKVLGAFERFGDLITRIEVYISDINGAKNFGNDKRIVLEARLQNMKPIAVAVETNNVHFGIKNSIAKMHRSVVAVKAKSLGY